MKNYNEITKINGYIVLGSELSHKGFDFNLIDRNGDVAIYSVNKKGRFQVFEVIRIKRHDGYSIAGNSFEPSEIYPRDNLWGLDGFTCMSLKGAKKRMQKIIDAGEARAEKDSP